MKRRGTWPEERGIALITVIAVLMLLALIAMPFALSMKDKHHSALYFEARARARFATESAAQHALHSLARTHRSLDSTPGFDTRDELEVLFCLEKDFFNPKDPRGYILSANVEDEQGKININTASCFLLGNLLGATVISEAAGPEETTLYVEDTSSFHPEGGLLWVRGELIRYARVSSNAFEGCERGVLSDQVEYREPQQLKEGTRIIDARAHMAVLYPIRKEPGEWIPFSTLTELKCISVLGPAAFDADTLERILPFLTVHSRGVGGGIWGPSQRILNDVTLDDPTSPTTLIVKDARFFGPGTVVRVSDGENVDFDVVLDSRPGQPRSRIHLEGKLGNEYRGGETLVTPLLRHPVNLNTASERILEALLSGIRIRGREEGASREAVRAIVQALSNRPVESIRDFLENVLRPLNEEGQISGPALVGIYLNALNSNDTLLEGGTAPFTFRSFDTFKVHAAGIYNSPAGSELARVDFTEVVQASVPSLCFWTLETQKDFEEIITATRTGRFLTTHPVNVAFQDGMTDPPPRAFTHLRTRRYPVGEWESEEERERREEREERRRERMALAGLSSDPIGEEDGDLRLAPSRLERQAEHFDSSPHPEGFFMERTSFQARGIRALRGDNGLMQPGSISFWYKALPGSGQRRFLFSGGSEAKNNRISLSVDPNTRELVFRLQDTSFEGSADSARTRGIVPWAETRVPLEDEKGVAEEDTWYHIQAVFGGTKPGDVALFVDGEMRGKPRYMTHLTLDIQGTGGENTEEEIEVESTEGFPRYGALVIGEEVFQYSGLEEERFLRVKRGIRGMTSSRMGSHPSGSTVRLLGYSNPITSSVPLGGASLSEELTAPVIGMIAGKDSITDDQGRSYAGTDEWKTSIPLAPPLSSLGASFFRSFQTSGFALLWSIAHTKGSTDPGDSPDQVRTKEGRTIGGVELIYYNSKGNSSLEGVVRGQAVMDMFQDKNVPANLFVPSFHTNYGYAIPLSVFARGGRDGESYLDPLQTNIAERIQVGNEWILYDEIVSLQGGIYFVRHRLNNLGRVREVLRDFLSNPSSQLLLRLQRRLIFRMVDWTYLNYSNLAGIDLHSQGTSVIPVFRVYQSSAAPGPGLAYLVGETGGRRHQGDRVTLMDPEGRGEAHQVNWAATGQRTRDTKAYHYMAFRENVKTRFEPTVGVVADWEGLDSRRITRVIMFPSGELPYEVPQTISFGSDFQGGSRSSGIVDEIEVVRNRYAPFRLGSTWGSGTDALPGDTEISLWGGMTAPDGKGTYRERRRGTRMVRQRNLPEDCGVFLMGDELIVYREMERNGNWIALRDCARGFMGTKPRHHQKGTHAIFLPSILAARLVDPITPYSARLQVSNLDRFQRQGVVALYSPATEQIEELVGYTRHFQGALEMPYRILEGREGEGILRGRYGTRVLSHGTDTIVLEFPYRYWDGYRFHCDSPGLAFFEAGIKVRDAFFHSVTWEERLRKPFINIRVLARTDPFASWDRDPEGTPGLFEFEDPSTEKKENRILRQGDSLELRVFFEYLPGAFNPMTRSNSWKETPELRSLRVNYLAPSRVLVHEEGQ